MKKVVIVTGANRGLGKAIVDLILKDDDTIVFSISRSLHEDQKKITSEKFQFIKTDLTEPFTVKLLEPIYKSVSQSTSIFYFNNAGIIMPIEEIGNHSADQIGASIAVNVQFPVELINHLVKNFSQNRLTVVNISSGAASMPIANWSLYCAAKAYMKAFCKVLAVEKEEGDLIRVHNVDPGVMDTGMQKEIRKNDFPEKEYFSSLKKESKLTSPDEAASNIINEINFIV